MSAQTRPLDRTIHRDEIKLKRGYAKLGTRRTDHARSHRKSAQIARMRLSQIWTRRQNKRERKSMSNKGKTYTHGNNRKQFIQTSTNRTETSARGTCAISAQRKRRAVRICGRGELKTKQNKSQNSKKLAQHQKMSSTMHSTRTKRTESRQSRARTSAHKASARCSTLRAGQGESRVKHKCKGQNSNKYLRCASSKKNE